MSCSQMVHSVSSRNSSDLRNLHYYKPKVVIIMKNKIIMKNVFEIICKYIIYRWRHFNLKSCPLDSYVFDICQHTTNPRPRIFLFRLLVYEIKILMWWQIDGIHEIALLIISSLTRVTKIVKWSKVERLEHDKNIFLSVFLPWILSFIRNWY